MKKQIIAILISCSLVTGCSAAELADEPLATEPPGLSNSVVSENTKVTEPTLPIKKEQEKEPSEEQLIDTSTTPTETVADQLAEPKAAEAIPQEDGATVAVVPEPVVKSPLDVTSGETELVIQETEPEPTQAPKPISKEPVQETVPPSTEPPATEPPVTEPVAEQLDVSALEAYGRSYASDTYGYNGTADCTPDTEAGYFPAATKTITSQEEAERIIQEAIDSQHKRDEAYGYAAYEEVDGEIVRCPVNVQLTPTGEPNEYTVTVYYGGTS